jgi:hypothetical protein
LPQTKSSARRKTSSRRELEAARYEASLAGRRYELVDPQKRHVARELEARWNNALERVAALARRIEELSAISAARQKIDRARLLQLAHDLPSAWNAPSSDTRTKQRLIHILVQEIVCNLDDATNEAVLLIHWTGGRHTEVRVPRVKTGRYPSDIAPTGRCGRMMRVFYGMGKGNAHRYQCRGDDAHVGAGLCIGIGGVRVDRAVALQMVVLKLLPADVAGMIVAQQDVPFVSGFAKPLTLRARPSTMYVRCALLPNA